MVCNVFMRFHAISFSFSDHSNELNFLNLTLTYINVLLS